MNGETALAGQITVGIYRNGSVRRCVAALIVAARAAEDNIVAGAAEKGVRSAESRVGGIDVVIPG